MTPAALRASTIDLLTDAREYFDNLSDAETVDGVNRCNPEMSLCARITELIAELEAQKPETRPCDEHGCLNTQHAIDCPGTARGAKAEGR